MKDVYSCDTFAAVTRLAEARGASMSNPSSARKRRLQSVALSRTLDRVQVLGTSDGETGHTGCVNGLSWAMNGELLLSGGDDTTVRVWRMDMSNSEQDHPWACTTVIRTGHRGNIFNAQMLPGSHRIVTVARDKQVRVADAGDLLRQADFGPETEYSTAQANIRVIRCHDRPVKRIITEDSADLFLTVSEDGTVRQHDLRVPHDCRTASSCPAPLVRLNHSLSTLALSPLTPYQFVVAGESPYGYLFDRRHIGRRIQEEWGVPLDDENVTTCVRRFGRAGRGSGETPGFEHITGAKMATMNGHEVLLSYSSDAVYLFSTRDTPKDPFESTHSTSILPSNPDGESTSSKSNPTGGHSGIAPGRPDLDDLDALMEEDMEHLISEHVSHTHDDMSEDEREGESDGYDDEMADYDELPEGDDLFATIPIVLPRRRFFGHCSVETVKDVNFLGPNDEFVVSGSDDGNFFVWDRNSGQIHDILEGDGHVVNVIEGHPHLPLIAVSGIDTTVKLFGPSYGPSIFSRLQNASSITTRNTEASSRRVDLAALATYARIARLIGGANADEQPCTTQ